MSTDRKPTPSPSRVVIDVARDNDLNTWLVMVDDRPTAPSWLSRRDAMKLARRLARAQAAKRQRPARLPYAKNGTGSKVLPHATWEAVR